MSEPTAAKRAEAAIRYFEKEGREVSGVTFNGREFTIEFTRREGTEISEVDLISMSR